MSRGFSTFLQLFQKNRHRNAENGEEAGKTEDCGGKKKHRGQILFVEGQILLDF